MKPAGPQSDFSGDVVDRNACGASPQGRMHRAGGQSGYSDPQDGFVIVAILWIVAALAVLAAVFMRFALVSAVAVTVHEERLHAEALVSAAIELTAFQITATDTPDRPRGAETTTLAAGEPLSLKDTNTNPPSPKEKQRPSKGAFAFRIAKSSASVTYLNEAARIDLNTGSRDVFARLFRFFGAKPDNADFYADRILGWRKRGDVAGQNDEASLYRDAGLTYAPRQGPFQSTAELWLVHGIPAAIKAKIFPFVTVYSGQKDVDLAIAAPEIMAANPQTTPEQPGQPLQRATGPLNALEFGRELAAGMPTTANISQSFRIDVSAKLDSGRTIHAEVVILVPKGSDEPYRVLSRQDDFDGF